jgi:two-component system, chemotaxis family, chemotaxis protein CheY
MRPVLIIEDERSTRDGYAALIEQVLGYPVVTAPDAQQALELLRAGLTPSLIVLDLSLPGMDGFAFRSQQLADPALASCPVLVCSGLLDDARNLEALKAAAYLQKPIEPEVLLRLVRALHQP